MSKTHKNPNKERRLHKVESDTHEERRNIRRVLDTLEPESFDELEEFIQMPYDRLRRDHPDSFSHTPSS